MVYVDFAALRNAGILQMLDGSRVGEDPEYRAFVGSTQFDYKQDLDAAMVAFAPSGRYMLLRGRFDWKSLSNYARAQGGSCNNSFCRMPGSTPERHISFFPVQTSTMALAVSTDESAALRMSSVDARPDRTLPAAPLWLSIPPSIVHSGQTLPEGTQMFARSLERAQTVTMSFAPEGSDYAARLDVRCSTTADAAALADQLSKTTGLLRDLIAHENKQPNPGDLSGFLTSGSFRSAGAEVQGYWPLSRALLTNLLSQ